jgi:hypothetical protein
MTAITFANLGVSATPDTKDGADASSYPTASWTPPTSGVIALCVMNRIANPGNVPTVSGNGITWTQVATLSVDPGAAHRITWFLADATGATTGVTTIDFAGETQISCDSMFLHITANLDISGGLAAAVVQAPNTNGTGTSGTVTFAAAGHADNRAVIGWFHQANEATNPDAAWTGGDDFAGSGPTRGAETQWKSDGVANNTSTWVTSSAYIGLGLELKATVSGAATSFPFDTPARLFQHLRTR